MKKRYLFIFIFLLAGCSALQAPHIEYTHLYLLDAQPTATVGTKHNRVLAVSPTTARSGYDTPQIAYLRQPLELEYFATHRWADTPAHMIKPLLTQALTAQFITAAPGQVTAHLRLDTELIRLQQDFTSQPSRVQITLRAQLIDVQEKRIIAVREFDETEPSASEDAYGGVLAANRALLRILKQIAEFCDAEAK
jgi:cholesterol transport system auxiliary component